MGGVVGFVLVDHLVVDLTGCGVVNDMVLVVGAAVVDLVLPVLTTPVEVV